MTWIIPNRKPERLTIEEIRAAFEAGGPGSGHFGHSGIPGHRGGSAPEEGGGEERKENVRRDPNLPAPPKDMKDLDRYLKEVEATPLYDRVQEDLAKLAKEVGPENLFSWSKMKNQVNSAYTEERVAKHAEILGKMLNPLAAAKEGETPIAVILMGPSGAGKSSLAKPLALQMAEHFTVCDSDAIKGMLPEYKGWNAAAVHVESSELSSVVEGLAMDLRHNVIMDTTGSKTDETLGIVNKLLDKGYEVHVINVELPNHLIAQRCWERFAQFNPYGEKDPTKEPSRLVPPRYAAHQVDSKPAVTYEHTFNDARITSCTAIDGDVPFGSPAKIIKEKSR